MKLQPTTVSDIIQGWNIMYPYPKNKAEEAFISAKFYKALRHAYSDEAFRMAAEMVEGEVDHFPTISHMKRLVNAVAEKITRDRDLSTALLPEETGNHTPEEIENNLKKLEIIKRMLTGELSMEDAEAEQKKITTYVQQ